MSVTIFVPGIKGTELYEGDNKRWFPATARDLEALSLENELEPREILSKVNAFFFLSESLYQGVIDSFINEDNFFPYTYDWRHSLIETAKPFVRFMISVAEEKKDDIVLVAHSMGGLLCKLAILELEKIGRVDIINRLVTIGTPWKGAPDAFKVLEYGEPGIYDKFSQVFRVFDDKKTRTLARKLPSVYQLMPTEEYFKYPYGNFIISAKTDDYTYEDVKSKIQHIYDEENKKTKDEAVFDVWKNYIDPLHKAMSEPLPVEHDCLIGIDEPTFYTFPEKGFRTLRLYKANALIKNGDGVVPFNSALPNHKANIYYVNSLHRNQCSHPSVLDFIKWVREGKEGSRPLGIGELPETHFEERALIENTKLKKGIVTHIMCPVETTILDNNQNYVAGVIDPSVSDYSDLAKSENLRYLQIGEAKYLYLNNGEETEELNFDINAYEEGIAEIGVEVFGEEETELKFNTIIVSPEKNAKLAIRNIDKDNHDIKVELLYDKKLLKPKVRKKDRVSRPNADSPTIDIKIEKAEETIKASHRPTYSGPVNLIVKSDELNQVEELIYSINNKIIAPITEEKVLLDLATGTFDIQVFGKDIFNRPIQSKKVTINIDRGAPFTRLNLTVTPEFSNLSFDVVTAKSKAKTFYRFIDNDSQLDKETQEVGWNILEKPEDEEVDVPYSVIKSLRENRNKSVSIQYFSENEFGLKEEIKSFEFAFRDLETLMWSEQTSVVTAKMIFRNVTGNTKAIDEANDIQIQQRVQSKYTPLDPTVDIGDNVRSVLFLTKDFHLEVFFSEKYALYFSGPPTELLDIGQKYTFSFELLTDRSKEKVTTTNPVARLKPIRVGSQLKETKIPLELKDGVFYGSFTVDELFRKYKHKLIITDIKNISPPLRESTLLLREEDE